MRENETRIGGLQWGLFSIFEPGEPRTSRTIDQSVVAWRLASINNGESAFENPRSVIQRTFSMVTGGSNREHHARLQDSIQPLRSANERARVNHLPSAPLPYNREELLRWHNIPDNDERTIPIIYRRRSASELRMEREENRRMTAEQVRARMEERESNIRSGFRYPSPAEVEEIERRFHNPELQAAAELAFREYIKQTLGMIYEPMPIRNAD